jgi:hypothetical protein
VFEKQSCCLWDVRGRGSAVDTDDVELGFHSSGPRHAGVTAITEVNPAPCLPFPGRLRSLGAERRLGEMMAKRATSGHQLGHQLLSTNPNQQVAQRTTKANSPDNSTSARIEQETNGVARWHHSVRWLLTNERFPCCRALPASRLLVHWQAHPPKRGRKQVVVRLYGVLRCRIGSTTAKRTGRGLAAPPRVV